MSYHRRRLRLLHTTYYLEYTRGLVKLQVCSLVSILPVVWCDRSVQSAVAGPSLARYLQAVSSRVSVSVSGIFHAPQITGGYFDFDEQNAAS